MYLSSPAVPRRCLPEQVCFPDTSSSYESGALSSLPRARGDTHFVEHRFQVNVHIRIRLEDGTPPLVDEQESRAGPFRKGHNQNAILTVPFR